MKPPARWLPRFPHFGQDGTSAFIGENEAWIVELLAGNDISQQGLIEMSPYTPHFEHIEAPFAGEGIEMAEGGTGHPSSQERSGSAGRVEKKLPEKLAALLKPEEVRDRRVRLMFQDEARFGRMVRIRRCWAPTPERPVVNNGYERQFVYVYGGVSPIEGELDWMICPKMNTERMGDYLSQVALAHPREFIVMVIDGASSHVAKDLAVPENIRLLRLPAYAPELNPQEHVWDEVRENNDRNL